MIMAGISNQEASESIDFSADRLGRCNSRWRDRRGERWVHYFDKGVVLHRSMKRVAASPTVISQIWLWGLGRRAALT